MEQGQSQSAELRREPAELNDGDVVLELTASSSSSLPTRSPALVQLKEALRESYDALTGSAAVQLETVALLEEVPARRATAWLRIHIEASGSGALAEPAVVSLLKSAAHGTVAILRWMHQGGHPRLRSLHNALMILSTGTAPAAGGIPPPTSGELARAIKAWQSARAALQPGESARVIMHQGAVDIHPRSAPADAAELLIEKKLVNPSADMIFVVEQPDYRGTGEWKLRHGQTRVDATCAPGTLLDAFYRRELDIRPGDALHCRVAFETTYGADYEVLTEKFRIVDVVDLFTTAGRGHGATDVGTRWAMDEIEEALRGHGASAERVREDAS